MKEIAFVRQYSKPQYDMLCVQGNTPYVIRYEMSPYKGPVPIQTLIDQDKVNVWIRRSFRYDGKAIFRQGIGWTAYEDKDRTIVDELVRRAYTQEEN